jgi:hypothetical protein
MDDTESKSKQDIVKRSIIKKPKNLWRGCLLSFFAITWILFALYVVNDIRVGWSKIFTYINPYEYSRWVTAHDRSRTAILVRDYHFDLNFRLFIVESGTQEIPTDINQAIWSSRDYNPTTFQDWGEEIEWSGDSSVVAVTIEHEYVFAYDFNTIKEIEDPEAIRRLLEEHELPPMPED